MRHFFLSSPPFFVDTGAVCLPVCGSSQRLLPSLLPCPDQIKQIAAPGDFLAFARLRRGWDVGLLSQVPTTGTWGTQGCGTAAEGFVVAEQGTCFPGCEHTYPGHPFPTLRIEDSIPRMAGLFVGPRRRTLLLGASVVNPKFVA